MNLSGDSIREVMNYFKINVEDTCAFGDMTNDISMLEAAGIAVCMLNGSDDAKAVSDIITDKTVDEDGWTVFVEDYIL